MLAAVIAHDNGSPPGGPTPITQEVLRAVIAHDNGSPAGGPSRITQEVPCSER